FVSRHVEFVDAFIGFVVPVTILAIIELIGRKRERDPGWGRYLKIANQHDDNALKVQDREVTEKAGALYSTMAIRIIMGTFFAIGISMFILAFVEGNNQNRMLLYGLIFLIISTVALGRSYAKKKIS